MEAQKESVVKINRVLIKECFELYKNGKNSYDRQRIYSECKKLLNYDEFWILGNIIIEWL